MPTKWQRLKLDLSKEDLDESEALEVADEAIKYIVKRTQKGIDMNGDRFADYAPYDKKYAKKKGQKNVDLTLSSDMLAAMKVLAVTKKGDVYIGYENGTKENGKADGNQRGTYGKSRPIAGKARPFLGLDDQELSKIIDKVTR